MGADVVKVEPPKGEDRRNTAAVVPNEGKYFQSLNRGKRSLTVDLSKPEGQALIHRIIPQFDVVLLNFRAGVADRLNIGYKRLSEINPGIVFANITGFGERGPYVNRAGSDIVAQAYSGVMAAEAKVDEHGAPQTLQSSTYIDRSTGLATSWNPDVDGAVSALVNLGYGRSEALAVVSRAAAQDGGATVEALIRAGLQELAAA